MADDVSNPRTNDDNSPIQGRNWFTARLEWLLGSFTPKCQQVTRMLSASLDHPLDLRARLAVQAHYLVCCYCRRYGQHLHHLRRLAVILPEHLEEGPIESLEERIKERMKKRLRDAR